MDQFKADYVATAHHADDLAETMVMKLVRGGRLNSLVGIAPERQFGNGKLIRPMLSFGKFEIRQYANDNTLKWFEDETNQNDENLRNRIRHHVMPQLKEENPLAIKHMVDYSKQLIKMITVSNHYIDNLLSGMVGDKHELDITNFNDFDDSLWTLLIQRWLEQFPKSVAVSNDQLTQIVRLINNPLKAQGEVDLNSQITVAKRYGKLVILNKSKKSFSTYQKNVDFMVPLNRWNQIEGGRSFGVFTHAPDNITPGIKIHELLLTEADFPLIYRHPKPGDRFEIENGGHQKVARFLINQKITTDDRKRIQLLVSNTDNVLAVLGYRVAKSSGNQDTNKYYLIEK
nr:tRNA lysidine(34) synthetase TilS [Lentilactobacillus kosonis]